MGGVNLAFLIISTDNGRATAACIVKSRGRVVINRRGAIIFTDNSCTTPSFIGNSRATVISIVDLISKATVV